MEYAEDIITEFLKGNKVQKILFVPYALRKQDEYFEKFRLRLKEMGFSSESIHTSDDPIGSVNAAQAIWIGGGNSFQLLKALYDHNLIDAIRNRALNDGIPYIGISAGTNMATCSICTTNDMPIVHPPSFKAIGFIPFNINPHYIEDDPNSEHKGETRLVRINQYHEIPDSPPVLGLREGGILLVKGEKCTIVGIKGARLFQRDKEPVDLEVGADISYLL